MKIVLLFGLMASAVLNPDAFGYGEGYADLVEKVQGAVVHIETTQGVQKSPHTFDPFEFFRDRRQNPRASSGSGFLISSDGYIVTNRHVVADSKKVKVLLSNNHSYEARLIGADNSLDVALLKIDAEGLPYFEMGDSDTMRIGDVLLAMGYPLELGFTVTTGIVSGIGRNLRTGNMDLGTYIQTDADITFGNSGGPLVNTRGKVIGINTLIMSRGETFGFAIPSNLFMHSVDQLRRYGKVRRGALGIQVGDLTPEALEYYDLDHGALVAAVQQGFPAEKAGIKRNDVILAINGMKVKNGNDVVAIIAGKSPGARVRLRLLSEGKEKEKTVKLVDRNQLSGEDENEPEERQPEESSLELGFSVVPLDESFRAKVGLSRNQRGMVIHLVDPTSLAAERGLHPGMVITRVNNKAVRSVRDIRSALKSVKKNQPVPLDVIELTSGHGVYVQSERTVFLRKQ